MIGRRFTPVFAPAVRRRTRRPRAGPRPRRPLAAILSNGIEYKGKSQIGIIAGGYGLGLNVALNAGFAGFDVSSGANRLSQSVMIVQRGLRGDRVRIGGDDVIAAERVLG